MPARNMGPHEIARFTRSMESQGVGVTRTKKGLLLRLPDKSSTMIHFTNSDVKAEQNVRARLRRAGVNHPDDQKIADLPAYITEGTVKPETKERLAAWVRKHNYPAEVFGKDLVKEMKMDAGQANRVLYHSGFVPEKALSRRGRAWRTPDWLLEEAMAKTVVPDDARELVERAGKAQAAIDAIIDAADEAKDEDRYQNPVPTVAETADPEWLEQNTAVPDDGQPDYELEGFEPGELVSNGEKVPVPRETITTMTGIPIVLEEPEKVSFQPPLTDAEADAFQAAITPEIDFIDERDSWVPDIEQLLGGPLTRMVRDRLEVLTAVGIDFEIRVWRKP